MVSIFCLLHLLITLTIHTHSSIVGPRNWLTKLTPAELAQVREQCSPKQSNVQVSNRIVGGEPAKPGEFKFAAVFTYPPPYPTETRCGATLISPRHLITARHCFERDRMYYKLWIGGVCHIPGTDYECLVPQGTDMVPVYYEFALFDAEYNRRFEYLDFAIIQLAKPIPESLFQSVQIACLPNVLDEDPPPEITLVGWGYKDGNQSTNLLHHITLSTDTDCSVDGSTFCAVASEDAPLAGSRGGDSGSAGVIYSKDIKNHVTHGVTITADRGGGRTTLVKTSYLLDDLCFYIGLCTSETAIGISPKLQLKSFYLPQGTVNSMPKIETPFRKISDTASKLYADNCKMSNALKGPKSDLCGLSTEWAVAIVASTDDEDKQLCDGVLVTNQHILTTRECILRHFKELESQIEDSEILIMQKGCMSDTCQWSTESIAWSYSHSMAIIQLQITQLLPEIHPACFSDSNTDNNKMFRGYGGQLKKVKDFNDDHTKTPYTLKDICDKNEYVCAKYTETCESETTEENDARNFGAGIVGVNSGALVGLKMHKRASWDDTTIELYWRTHKLNNALCIYFNRCDDNEFLFWNNIPCNFTDQENLWNAINDIRQRLKNLENADPILPSVPQMPTGTIATTEISHRSNSDGVFVLSVILAVSLTVLFIVGVLQGYRRFKRRSTVQQKATLSRTVVSSTEKRPRLSSGRDVPTGFSGSKISIIENAQPRHFGMADQFHSAKISDPRSSSSDAASNTSQPVLRSILKKNGIYRQYSSPGELNYCNN